MIAKYKALKRPMRVVAEGKVIGGGFNFKPAPYLPILEVVPDTPPVVIKKGTFVTLDQNGYIIPAYQAQTSLVYSQIDVQYGVVDIDTGNKVTQPKTSTTKISGKPIGIAPYDMYLNIPEYQLYYNIQPTVGVLTEGLILLALDSAHASVTYSVGDVLVLGEDGYPIPATLGSSGTYDPNLVVGKLIMVVDATDANLMFAGGYDKVAPASGLDLPGIENQGILDGIDETTKKGLLIKLGF